MNKLEKVLELIKGGHFGKGISMLQEAIKESSVLNDKDTTFLNTAILSNAKYSFITDLVTRGVVSAQDVSKEIDHIIGSVANLVQSMKAYEEIIEAPDPEALTIEVKLSKTLAVQSDFVNKAAAGGVGAAIFGIFLLLLSKVNILDSWSDTAFVVGMLCIAVSSSILFMFRKKGTEQLNQAITSNIKSIDELQDLSINLIQIIKGLRRYITGNITEVHQFIDETAPALERLSFLPNNVKESIKDKQLFLDALQEYSDELEEVISNTQNALINGDLRKLHTYRQTTASTVKKVRLLMNTNKKKLNQ